MIWSQGPKECSSEHFWSMIWHETRSPAVVVMLTQTHDAGKEKCFNYFPMNSENLVLEIGAGTEPKHNFQARLELLDSYDEERTRSTVRKLSLKVGKEEKIIWHYLFIGWPDFYIPEGEDRLALLELLKQTALVAREPNNPRVIHCSAGVGRTGTFIALDFLLGELRSGAMDEISTDQDRIAETVNELRKQRMMMVQGESQFEFLYKIMKEQWLEKHGLSSTSDSTREETSLDTIDSQEGTQETKDLKNEGANL